MMASNDTTDSTNIHASYPKLGHSDCVGVLGARLACSPVGMLYFHVIAEGQNTLDYCTQVTCSWVA